MHSQLLHHQSEHTKCLYCGNNGINQLGAPHLNRVREIERAIERERERCFSFVFHCQRYFIFETLETFSFNRLVLFFIFWLMICVCLHMNTDADLKTH